MINIKEYVAAEKEKIKEWIHSDSRWSNTIPTLHIVQVGDNEASNRYVRNKMKDCEEVGIAANLHKLSDKINSHDLQLFVDKLDGPIIVQLPLPAGVKVPHINPVKDVDGFEANSKFTPCTPGGIMEYLRECGLANGEGKLAVVIGRSEIVGKPMAKLLLENNWTTAVVHSKTSKETKNTLLRNADLVVCAVGKAGFLDPKDCPHAFIVDVGINFDENGKLVGDVQKINSDTVADRITPVPGGVGLLTRLQLMKNVVKFYGMYGD